MTTSVSAPEATRTGVGGALHGAGRPIAGVPRRVLVTDGEERSALAIVRSLGRHAEVHVCSRSGRSLAGASRYARSDSRVRSPLNDRDAAARDLAAAARRVGAEVVFPVSEASLLAVLACPELFDGIAVPFPDEARFRRVCDKAAVLAAARDLGIATPGQHVLEHASNLTALLRAGDLRFPLVVKPSRSVVSDAGGATKVGVSHAADEQGLRECVARYGAAAFPLLLQQRIVGPGIGVFLLRWHGETVAVFCHRRLREKPPAGGVSVYSESIAPMPALIARSNALLDRFAWDGVAMVEFKVDDATGTPYLMEINGRFWGSLELAIAAGVDFPALLLALAGGESPAPVRAYRVGIRNRWWWGDVDHLLTRFRHSNDALGLPRNAPSRLRALGDFLRWRAADHNEVLHASDPRPFLRETALWLRGR